MQIPTIRYRWAVLAFAAVLTGCGGGSSSDSDSDAGVDGDAGGDPGPGAVSYEEGVFLDSAVAGLEFRLGAEVLTTDEQGTFRFEDGAPVEFFIGGISLGTAAGKSIVTPIDLVEGAADETDPVVINIIRFLQTLDDDGNPGNGIAITAEVRNLAGDKSVNFQQDTDDFAASTQSLVNELTASTASGARDLVSINFALTHFRGTLADINGGGAPGPDLDGDVISSEEVADFFYAAGPGVWRTETRMQYTFEFGFDVPAIGDNAGYRLTADQEVSGFNRGVMLSTGSDRETDFCTAEGLTRDDDLNTDEEPFDEGFCDDPSVEYLRVSSTAIGMRAYCGDELWVEALFEKISSAPGFDQGGFTMNSPELPDVAASEGVCGYLADVSNTTSNVSPSPNDAGVEAGVDEFWTMRIATPYQGARLEMDISLQNQGQQAGTYPVNPGGADAEAPRAYVTLSSPAFDSGLAAPSITGGSVTIDSVTALTASGSYDLTTSTGNTLSGRFDLDLN